MIDFKVLYRIKKNAIKSIKSDSDGQIIDDWRSKVLFILIYYILPVVMAVFPWIFCVTLSSFSSYITTGVSIFTGLFFSLLLNISAKIRIEKQNENVDIANFQAFKENMRQISDITLYIIILGISAILVILLNSVLKFELIEIELCFTSIVIFILMRYFICLLLMLQRFFFVLRDEIKNIL